MKFLGPFSLGVLFGVASISALALAISTPPVVNILSPTQGAIFSPAAHISVSAHAVDDDAVAIVRASVDNEDKTDCRIHGCEGIWNCPVILPFKPGSVKIRVTAYDTTGQSSEDSVTVNVQ